VPRISLPRTFNTAILYGRDPLNITPVPASLPQDFYVYEHRKATTGEVFYVGKGVGRRAWFTYTRSRHWKNIAAKHGVVVEIVMDGLQDWFALELEQQIIAMHGRQDCGFGCLINLTDGGEGVAGRIMPDEQRRNLSAAKSTPESISKNIAVHLGRKRSLETRAKQSAAKLGKPASQAAKAAREIAMNRPEVKEKLRLAQLDKVTDRQLQAHGAKKIMCIETGLVFVSTGDAKRWLRSNGHPKANNAHVWSCCNGDRKTAYGYTWQYA